MVISQRASSPVSHGPGTSAPSRAYAPTSASICGMLFLPNSTRRVPSVCRTRADPRPTDRQKRAGRFRADKRRGPPRSRRTALDWPATAHAGRARRERTRGTGTSTDRRGHGQASGRAREHRANGRHQGGGRRRERTPRLQSESGYNRWHWEETRHRRYVRKFFRREMCFGTESRYQIP